MCNDNDKKKATTTKQNTPKIDVHNIPGKKRGKIKADT